MKRSRSLDGDDDDDQPVRSKNVDPSEGLYSDDDDEEATETKALDSDNSEDATEIATEGKGEIDDDGSSTSVVCFGEALALGRPVRLVFKRKYQSWMPFVKRSGQKWEGYFELPGTGTEALKRLLSECRSGSGSAPVLEAADFVTDFHPYDHGILDSFKKVSIATIRTILDRLVFLRPGEELEAGVETLLVVLPVGDSSGKVTVTSTDKTKTASFAFSSQDICWIAPVTVSKVQVEVEQAEPGLNQVMVLVHKLDLHYEDPSLYISTC